MSDQTFLSAEDIDAMDVEVERTLPNEAAITRSQRVSDGMGGWVTTDAPIATVPCRISDAELRYALEGDRSVSVTQIKVVLPRGTDVKLGDIITIDGLAWTVNGQPLPSYRSLVVDAATRRA